MNWGIEKESKDKYNEAYNRLVHFYNNTNNMDALDLMEVAENSMAHGSHQMFDWNSWLEQANKLLAVTPEPAKLGPEPTPPKIIHYSPSLRITNIEALPHGVGAKFLVVIPGEKGEWIAKQWKRKIPILNPNETLIDFPALSTVIKEPWQMTSKEWDNEIKARKQVQMEAWNKSGSKGFPPSLKIDTVAARTDLAEKASYVLPRDADLVMRMPYHKLSVEAAMKEGKPVPPKVLNEYTDKPKKSRPSPLPPEAQNVQTVPFDSQMFECYGKPTGKGFRAYCRRK